MAEDNRAAKHFKDLNLSAYISWYDSDTLKYLIHSVPKAFPHLRYVFTYASRESFLQEFQQLVLLSNDLKQPALFICIEPDEVYVSVGLFHQGNLAVINPVGVTAHRDFYQTLQTLHTQGLVTQFYVSKTIIQRDPNGLMSCGPLCVELIRHFSQLPIQTVLSLFQSGEIQIKEEVKLGIIDTIALLPSSLQACVSFEDEVYQQYIESLRWNHQVILEALTKNAAEQAINADEQNIMAQLVVEKKGIFEIINSIIYERLKQKKLTTSPETVQPNLQKTNPKAQLDEIIAQETRGGGDCAFHALFGEWDLETKEFVCKDVAIKRQQVAERVKKCKTDESLFSVVKEAITNLIMEGRPVEGNHIAQAQIEFKASTVKSHDPIIWATFESVLSQFNSIQGYIEEFTTHYIEHYAVKKGKKIELSNLNILTSNAEARFMNCLNEDDGRLKEWIIRTPELSQAYRLYEKSKRSIDWVKILNDQNILDEYAASIGKPGNWLLPLELHIIAKAFNISVSYHQVGIEPIIYNPLAKESEQPLSVYFNGTNHYQKMVSKQAAAHYERAKLNETPQTAYYSQASSVGQLNQAQVININHYTYPAANEEKLSVATTPLTPSILSLPKKGPFKTAVSEKTNASQPSFVPSNKATSSEEDLFNFCKNQYYEHDLAILQNKDVFNQSITCYAYFAKEDDFFLQSVEELAEYLAQYNIHLKSNQTHYDKKIFNEEVNKLDNRVLVFVTSNFIANQDLLISPIWKKIEGCNNIVPFLIEKGLEDKLSTVFAVIKPIDGTSSCLYEKIWDIIHYLHHANNNYSQAVHHCTHKKRIRELSNLFKKGNKELIQKLVDKFLYYQNIKSEKSLQDLLKDVEDSINTENNSSNEHLNLKNLSPLADTVKKEAKSQSHSIDSLPQLPLPKVNQQLNERSDKESKDTSAVKNKKLPEGQADFTSVKENFHFVDKSLLIKEVIDNNEKLVKLILRPRRFGKSLNMSMLEVFFNQEMKDKAGLFHDLKIWQQGEQYKQEQGQYPVIFFSFITTKSSGPEDTQIVDSKKMEKIAKKAYKRALATIRQLIADLYQKFDYLSKSQHLTKYEKNNFQQLLEKTADDALTEKALAKLIVYLGKHHKKKVVLLIDEYDTSIHDSYEKKYYHKMVAFMSNFLGSALKQNPTDNCEPYLKHVVMTGILQVAKTGLFSGVNNIKIYSVLSELYNEHFGFTENEVIDLLNASRLNVSVETLRHQYGGYRIGSKMVFNPYSIVSFLNQEQGPQLQFDTAWIKSGDIDHTSLIFQLLQDPSTQLKEDIKQLVENKTLDKMIDEKVVLQSFYPLTDQSHHAIWSLLLLSGYLTLGIADGMELNDQRTGTSPYWKLVIPNKEIYGYFQQQCLQWFPHEAKQWKFINLNQLAIENFLLSYQENPEAVSKLTLVDKLIGWGILTKSVDLLIPLLGDKEAKIRQEVRNRLAQLAQSHHPDVLRFYQHQLDSSERMFRQEALQYLFEINGLSQLPDESNEKVVTVLNEMLSESHSQMYAGKILASLPEPIKQVINLRHTLENYLNNLLTNKEFQLVIQGKHERIQADLQQLFVALKMDSSRVEERELLSQVHQQFFEQALTLNFPQYQQIIDKVVAAAKQRLGLTSTQQRFVLTKALIEDILKTDDWSVDERAGLHEIIEHYQTYLVEINRQVEHLRYRSFHTESQTLASVYQEFHHFVILGDPGSGKTTLLKWLTLKMADAYKKNLGFLTVKKCEVDPSQASDELMQFGIAYVPLFISIWHYAAYRQQQIAANQVSAVSIKNYLGSVYSEAQMQLFDYLLQQGQMLISMDGFDEVPHRQDQTAIIKEVEEFLVEYGQRTDNQKRSNRVILTARIAGNVLQGLNSRIPRFIVEPMSLAAIEQFYRAWFRIAYKNDCGERIALHDALIKADATSERLIKDVRQRVFLRDLSKVPLLAHMIAGMFYKKGELPTIRAQLYEDLTQQAIEYWQERNRRAETNSFITSEILLNILKRAAYEMHENHGSITKSAFQRLAKQQLQATFQVLSKEGQLEQEIDHLLLLLSKDVGLLCHDTVENYRFLHRTLEEDLAGCALIDDISQAGKRLAEKIIDPIWREPILLALGHLSIHHPEHFCGVLQTLLEQQNYHLILPAAALHLTTNLLEFDLTNVPTDEWHRIILKLIDMLFVAYYSTGSSHSSEPLRQCIQHALYILSEKQGVYQDELKNVLLNKLTQPEMAPSGAHLIQSLSLHDAEIARALLNAAPYDSAVWHWSIDRALLSLKEVDHLEFRNWSVQYKSALARWLNCLPLRAVITVLYGGYTCNDLSKWIREFYSIYSYLRLSSHEQNRLNEAYKHRWGEKEIPTAMSIYSNTLNQQIVSMMQEIPNFALEKMHRHSPFSNTLRRMISQSLLSSDVALGFKTLLQDWFRTASLKTLSELSEASIAWIATGFPVIELTQYLATQMGHVQPILQGRLAQLIEDTKGLICQLAPKVWSLWQKENIQSNDNVSMQRIFSGQVLLTQLLEAGAAPLITDISHFNNPTIQSWWLQEYLALLLTGVLEKASFSDIEERFDQLSQYAYAPKIIIDALMTLSHAAQWRRPVAGCDWHGMIFRSTSIIEQDIPIALFNLLASRPRPLAVMDEWLCRSVLKPCLLKQPELLAETVVLIMAQLSTPTHREKLLNLIAPNYLRVTDWRLAVLHACQSYSAYYRMRALLALIPIIHPEEQLPWPLKEQDLYNKGLFLQPIAMQTFQIIVSNLLPPLTDIAQPGLKLSILEQILYITSFGYQSADHSKMLWQLSTISRVECLTQALNCALQIKEIDAKVYALARLLSYSDLEKQATIMANIFQIIETVTDSEHRAEFLKQLRPLWVDNVMFKQQVKQLCINLPSHLQDYVHGKRCQILSDIFQVSREKTVDLTPLWLAIVIGDAVLSLNEVIQAQQLELDNCALDNLSSQWINRVKRHRPVLDWKTALKLTQCYEQGNEHAEQVVKVLPYFSTGQQEALIWLATWIEASGLTLCLIALIMHLLLHQLHPHRITLGYSDLRALLLNPYDIPRYRVVNLLNHPEHPPRQPTRLASIIGRRRLEELRGSDDPKEDLILSQRIAWLCQDVVMDDPINVCALVHRLSKISNASLRNHGALGNILAVNSIVWNLLIHFLQMQGTSSQAIICLVRIVCQLLAENRLTNSQWLTFHKVVFALNRSSDYLTHFIFMRSYYHNFVELVKLLSTNKDTSISVLADILEQQLWEKTSINFSELLSLLSQNDLKEALIQLTKKNFYVQEDVINKWCEATQSLTVDVFQFIIELLYQLLKQTFIEGEKLNSCGLILLAAMGAAYHFPLIFMRWTQTDIIWKKGEREEFIQLLAQAAIKSNRFELRAAAIRLLGGVGQITSEVFNALCEALHDVPLVQQSAYEAVQVLNHFDRSFNFFLSKLTTELNQTKSIQRAFIILQMLKTVAHNAQTTPNLHNFILEALVRSFNSNKEKQYLYLEWPACAISTVPTLNYFHQSTLLRIVNLYTDQQVSYSLDSRLKDKSLYQQLLNQLKQADVKLRADAFANLTRWKKNQNPEVQNIILMQIHSRQSDKLSLQSIAFLFEIGLDGEKLMIELLALFVRPDVCMHKVAKLSPEKLVVALEIGLESQNIKTRQMAAQVLLKLGLGNKAKIRHILLNEFQLIQYQTNQQSLYQQLLNQLKQADAKLRADAFANLTRWKKNQNPEVQNIILMQIHSRQSDKLSLQSIAFLFEIGLDGEKLMIELLALFARPNMRMGIIVMLNRQKETDVIQTCKKKMEKIILLSLLEIFKSEADLINWQQTFDMLQRITQLSPKELVAVLKIGLESQNITIRQSVAEALLQFKLEDEDKVGVCQILAQNLRISAQANNELGWQAAWDALQQLGKCSSHEVIVALNISLKVQRVDIRQSALQALLQLGLDRTEIRQILLQNLRISAQANNELGWQAAWGALQQLGECSSYEVIAALETSLDVESIIIRQLAAEALLELQPGKTKIRRTLLQNLQISILAGNEWGWQRAWHVLEQIEEQPSEETMAILEASSIAPNEMIRQSVAEAKQGLSQKRLEKEYQASGSPASPLPRMKEMIEVLKRTQSPRYIPIKPIAAPEQKYNQEKIRGHDLD